MESEDVTNFLDIDDDSESESEISPNDNDQNNDTNQMNIDNEDEDSDNDNNNTINVNNNGIIRVEDLFAKQADEERKQKAHLPTAMVDHATSLSFDLGHIMCYDPSPIDGQQIFKEESNNSNKSNKPNKLNQTDYEIRKLKEKYLYDITRSNVQAMVNKLFSLPPVKTGIDDEPGIVVKLPPMKAKLPRSKPVPQQRPLTRWEKFAARKGIRTAKKTKDLLSWDESTASWKKKYGYKKANNPMDAPIFEHKENDFDVSDPWTKMEKNKKKRIAINKENQMRNLKEALGDRVSGTLDLQSVINHSKNKNKKQIGKRAINEQKKFNKQKYGHLNTGLNIAQHSTASMGKFDKLNRNEPKPSLKKNNKKTIDYLQTNQNTKIHKFKHGKDSFQSKERNKQNEVLFNIFGKQQTDGFNIEKATQNAQVDIERQRAANNRRKNRNKFNKRR